MKKAAISSNASKLSPFTWGLIIFAVGLAVRLIYLFELTSTPLADYLTIDPRFYVQTAQKIASGQGVGSEILFKAPFYPYLLALLLKLLGSSLFVPRIIQALLGSLISPVIFLIARRFYSHKIAVTAGLVASLYGTLVFWGNEIIPLALVLVANLTVLWLLLEYEKIRKQRLLLYAGLLLGISIVTHPAALALIPVVLHWLYHRMAGRKVEWRSQAITFTMGVLFLLVPAWVHNIVVGGEIVPFSTYGGINFAMDNNDRASGYSTALPDTTGDLKRNLADAVSLATQRSGSPETASSAGWYWLGQGIKFVVSHPLDFVGLEFKKLVYLISGYETTSDKQVYFFAARSNVLRFLVWDKLLLFPFGLILPLALVAVFTTKDRFGKHLLLYGYVLSYIVVILLFVSISRYRLFILPILIIWASAGFWRLVQFYNDKDFREFYRYLMIFVAAILICNGITFIPGISPRLNTDYDGYLFTGNAYYNAGKYDEAERNFYKAAMANPRSAIAFANLGNTSIRQGKDSLAADYYERAISIDPGLDQTKRSLAGLYHKHNEIKKLNDLVVAEIKRNPKSVWSYLEYSYVHVILEEYDMAAELCDKALEADSTAYDAIFQKGDIYLRADMRADAEREFLKYIQYVPNSVEAHADLGQVYSRQNKFDLALDQFNIVQRIQPNSPASYFNLASIYYQMGQYDKSDELLDRTALLSKTFPGIDKQRAMNAEARRAAQKK